MCTVNHIHPSLCPRISLRSPPVVPLSNFPFSLTVQREGAALFALCAQPGAVHWRVGKQLVVRMILPFPQLPTANSSSVQGWSLESPAHIHTRISASLILCRLPQLLRMCNSHATARSLPFAAALLLTLWWLFCDVPPHLGWGGM